MDKHDDSLESEMRQYMLGQLSELDEQRFEERAICDDEKARDLEELAEVVQEELLEDYYSGELNEGERTAFEQRFLDSSEVRDKLLLNQALVERARRGADAPGWTQRIAHWLQPLPQPALAALTAAVLVIAGGGGIWSVARIGQLESELNQAGTQRSQLVAELDETRQQLGTTSSLVTELQQELQATASQAAGMLATFILPPGLVRSGGETVTIPSDQGLIELKLDLGLDEYESYQATLYDSAGAELLVQNQLPADSADETVYVVLQLTTSVLPPDDYRVDLSGVDAGEPPERIDSYPFRVTQP